MATAAAATAADGASYHSTPRVTFNTIHPPTTAMSSLEPPPANDGELCTPPPKVVRSSPSVAPRHKLSSARVQPMSRPADYRSASNRSLHSVVSSPICRICHETGAREALLSPCKCRGTVGLVHRSCIERWLSAAHIDACEICRFRYRTVRQDRSFREWITSRSEMPDLRNLLGDVCCFILLTPLTAVSAWLCISGAVHYANSPVSGPAGWETIGLLSLSIFLVIVYLVWCLVAGRYHARVFVQWRRLNQIVVLLMPSSTQAVVAVEDRPRRPTSAEHLPPVTGPLQHPAVPACTLVERRPPVYSRLPSDGRWMFGRLPATSVSDTAASAPPAVGANNITRTSKHGDVAVPDEDRQQQTA